MTLPLEVDGPDGVRLRLNRAWPRSSTHLLLEYVDPAGRCTAGQWFADAADLRAAAARTPDPAYTDPTAGVLLQPAGADGRLNAVAGLLGRPGVRLLSHRPGRRAVLRAPAAAVPELVGHHDGEPTGVVYVKVVRPSRAAAVRSAAECVQSLAGAGLDVPIVLGWDDARGLTALAELPGPTLLETGRTATPDELTAVWHETGAAIGRLHDGAALGPDGAPGDRTAPGHDSALPRHDAAAEHALTVRWLALAAAHGVLPALATGPLTSLLTDAPGPDGLLHRDLHDKQVITRPSPEPGRWRIGMLDVDTLAVGERALDIANLQAHLLLRTLQGELTPAGADAAGHALLTALDPDPRTVARLPAHRTAALMRLAAVYAFRPRWQHVCGALLDAASQN